MADCGYRAPPAPRLARPPLLILPTLPPNGKLPLARNLRNHGSRATAIAASKTGRIFVGYDINPEYVELAKQRIKASFAQRTLF